MSQPCSVFLKDGETCVEGTHQNVFYLQNQIRQLLGVDASVPLNKIKLVEDKDSGKNISPEIRHAIKILYPSIEVDKLSDEELLSNESFCLKYLEGAASLRKPAPTGFTYEVCQVPLIAASFLVEIFGVSQLCPHKVEKKLVEDSPIITLFLPIPIPVRFQSTDGKRITLFVSNSAAIPNSLAQQLLSNAIQVLSQKALIISHYVDVDVEGFEDDILHNLAVKNEMYILRSSEKYSNDCSYRSFDLYATSKDSDKINEQQAKKYNANCERIFFSIARRECNECHQIVSDSQHDECVSYNHEGKRIPFDDGELEHVTQDDEGNTIVLVRYTCCPDMESILNDSTQGCVEIHHGNHKTSPQSDLSSWTEDKLTTFSAL